MQRAIVWSFAVVLLGAACRAGEPASEYLGKWNIKLLENTDTFGSAWLKVEKAGGGLRGWMVWKWGSVTACNTVEVTKGELVIERRRAVFRARVVGGELLGFMRPKRGRGRTVYFVGRRASELCDPTGTWLVVPEDDPTSEVVIVLKRQGKKLLGKGTDTDGYVYPAESVRVEGNQIFIRARDLDGGTLQVKGTIQGDRIELTVRGGSLAEPVRLEGKRKRKWGKPIRLFDGKTLKGWGPRDPRRKFGWHVENGAFTNSPPDVDIVSERTLKDFKLHLQYKVNAHSNSGCYLRGRYELQILGDLSVQPHGNMAVYSRLSPTKNPMRPMGQWQSLEVTLIGRYVTVVLNGVVVHDNAYLEGITGGALDPWEDRPGPLLLQGDHGKVWFRNVLVTPAQ